MVWEVKRLFIYWDSNSGGDLRGVVEKDNKFSFGSRGECLGMEIEILVYGW